MKMKKSRIWFSVSIACTIFALPIGCTSNDAGTKVSGRSSQSPVPETVEPNKGPDATAPKKTETTPASPAKTETPVANLSETLPAELKHEGFEYYGLGVGTPVDFVLKNTANGQTSNGARVFKLNKVENGKAYFTQSHTGGLSPVGDYEIMVDKAGVWVISSSTVKVEKPQQEIPAKLTPGVTWHTKSDLEDTEYRVVGPETIKTAMGDRKTILITGKGTAKINGADVPVESKFWCAKGLGQVRTEMKTIPKANQGKPQTVTMEETVTK